LFKTIVFEVLTSRESVDKVAQRTLRNFVNKKDAVDLGRQTAKNFDLGQLKIQREDGTF
jgi:hypothetical protein